MNLSKFFTDTRRKKNRSEGLRVRSDSVAVPRTNAALTKSLMVSVRSTWAPDVCELSETLLMCRFAAVYFNLKRSLKCTRRVVVVGVVRGPKVHTVQLCKPGSHMKEKYGN